MTSASTPDYDLAAWRKRIPIIASSALVPMNNCSQAPQTDATRAAAERYLDSWNTSGMDWEAWMAEVALAKREFAALINASPDDIAVFSSGLRSDQRRGELRSDLYRATASSRR